MGKIINRIRLREKTAIQSHEERICWLIRSGYPGNAHEASYADFIAWLTNRIHACNERVEHFNKPWWQKLWEALQCHPLF
jgi:hypothetical protein